MPTALPPWAPIAKPALTIAFLAALWTWETFFPLVHRRQGRWRHAGRNLAIAVLNTVVLALLFGAATVGVASWATEHQFGLLNRLGMSWRTWRLLPAILLLDGWLYVWHRMNHRLPLLWRFHRMHHADAEVDVTTATRFHLGEHLGAATLRLGLIPLFGVNAFEIVVFETLVVANTMLHHANISLGRLDRPLRSLIVTPRMHQVHHSRWRPETDSNYSTLFSFWDRLFGSYRMRPGNAPVALGLEGFDNDRWQTVAGMLRTPFIAAERAEARPSENMPSQRVPHTGEGSDVR
jgi:sterol desaturase/sphingolipid hydroxylase (fatty acid hydroxylase superfamily)